MQRASGRGTSTMGIIRKRLATSREPSAEAPGTQPTEGDPAQPLDEHASSPPAASEAPRKTSKRANDVTRPLVIVRVRSKPRQIAQVSDMGMPDWSLSAGVAIVLFGLAAAYGTFAILDQREAMKSEMQRLTRHEEPRPAARQEPPAPTIPPVEVAQAPRPVIDTPQIPVAASSIAPVDTKLSHAASAPSVAVVASNKSPEPVRASIDAPPTAAAKPPIKRGDAVATPVLARQAPKITQEVASTTPTRARAAPSVAVTSPMSAPAPKTRRTGPAPAGVSLGSSQGSNARQEDRVVHEPPPTARPPARTVAAAAVPRENVAALSDTSAMVMASAAAQPRPQAETPVSLRSAENKDLFRGH